MADYSGYDDAKVTLGDGCLNIESAMFGVEKVSGSRSFVRDPRLSALADKLPQLWVAPNQMAQLAPGTKWCAVCGDVRPKHYFSPDKRAYDGLDYRCKECENERKRRMYADSVGHEPRAYVRREKAAS